MPRMRMPKSDAANAASKLPRPVQWPAGALGGFFESVMGANDPNSIMGAAAPTPLTTQFIKGGVPDVGARKLSTALTTSRLRAMAPAWAKDRVEKWAAKYPRVTAHMSVGPMSEGMGQAEIRRELAIPIGGMDAGYGVSSVQLNPKAYSHLVNPDEFVKTVAHEGAHVAQGLGNKDANWLYGLANSLTGYGANPFELSAEAGARRAVQHEPTNPFSVNSGLKDIVEVFGNTPQAQEIAKILRARGVIK